MNRSHHDTRPAEVTGHPHAVLVVDLDGTLISTDLLFEAVARVVRESPWLLVLLPFWLLRGRAFLKTQLARRIDIDAAALPYRHEVVEQLRDHHRAGRRLVLATASPRRWADKVAQHLGIFDSVLATDESGNVKGKGKRSAIQAYLGDLAFEYMGDSRADFHVWRGAVGQHVVSSSASFRSMVKAEFPGAREIAVARHPMLMVWIRALRCHQWVKNLLLFVPLIMAHQFGEMEPLLRVLVGCIAFCLCASGVYLWNDIADVDADRAHHRKCNRPIASGALPIAHALVAVPLLFAAAFTVSLYSGSDFQVVLLIYAAITSLYTVWLKKLVLIDILTLAGLYTLRIFAGGVAAAVVVSHWLFVFSLFFFLSLAAVKRFSELFTLRKRNLEESAGRGYRAEDLEQVAVFGASSGYLSVLVLALYVSSDEVRGLYTEPQLLWFICPLLLYWVSRVWLLAHRGVLHEDPIVFAITDRSSYVVGLCVAAVLAASI
ncbi:MAG: UbiA family prenyltransferase [Bdellovibrionota bacterium]|nr:MAG: UbiA family prenyltransferase [Bdellovibrionota bacterium]